MCCVVTWRMFQRLMRRWKRAPVAVAVVVLALTLKVVLLLTSQRAVDGDEAIVGLMALHAMQGQHPLFLYGQAYDAGAGVLAHLAAGMFAVGGVSAIMLKLTALLIWIALVAVAVLALRGIASAAAAAWVAVLLLACPTTVEWASKARGGHMLAALALVAALGIAWNRLLVPRGGSRAVLRGAWAFALLMALAPWLHPSAFPTALGIVLVVLIALLWRHEFGASLAIAGVAVVAACAVRLVPRGAAWSPSHFVGGGVPIDLKLLAGKVLPGLFTPDLDWSVPPSPTWVVAVGWMWFISAIAAFAVLLTRSRPHEHRDQRDLSLLLLVPGAAAAVAGGLVVDFRFAGPYPLLVFAPLACMAIAGALTSPRVRRRRAARAIGAMLVLSGIAVHLAAIGAPTVHGAGEQQRRLDAAVIGRMLADLRAHGVTEVFSESPMLPWNLMFEGRERVAARWITARDRWQPYVERVNEAFRRGVPCALLLRLESQRDRLVGLRPYDTEGPRRVSVFGDRYALVYDPPAALIRARFAFDEAPAPSEE